MANLSGILAWTEKPGGLQPMGSQSQTGLSNRERTNLTSHLFHYKFFKIGLKQNWLRKKLCLSELTECLRQPGLRPCQY